MKILLVTPSYHPIIGGSETLTRMLAIKLNEMGIQTDIMTFNMNKKWHPFWKEETKRDNQTRVFRVPALNPFPGLPNPLFNLFRINVIPNPSFIKKFKHYDIIHFIGEADLSFPIISHFIKKPKVFHCVAIFRHGGLYKYYKVRRPFLGKIFKKFFPNLADAYIIYAVEEKKVLTDLGVSAKKILDLPLSIDTESFRYDKTKKIDNLILFVGRIYEIKGLHILLNALLYIETPIQLAIIGPRDDEEYVRQIEQMAHAINARGVHKVKLLGAMDHKDLVPWYQKASILVCPYNYETYNTVTLEALACGTPVISTGTHVMGKASDGILVTSKNPKQIASALRKLLEDKELREKYGREGRKLIEEHFSSEAVVKKLAKIYLDLLKD